MMRHINSPHRNGENNFLTIVRAHLDRYTKTVRDEEVAEHIGVHPAAFSRMLKSDAYVATPHGQPARTDRGVGGAAWTVDRWFKALEFLGIDPHSAIDAVFGNQQVIASEGGDETTAKIVSILTRLGDDDSILALLRMVREIKEQRGDIGIVLDAVRAVHKAAVPKKTKQRTACEVSKLFAENG